MMINTIYVIFKIENKYKYMILKKLILDSKNVIQIFIFLNLQFIFDYYSKIYHIEFINSFNSNINIKYFLYFQLLSFITFGLQNCERIINKKIIEKTIYITSYNYINNYVENISTTWIENNSSNILSNLYQETAKINYEKYFNLIELYGAIIRVITNIYILYYIYDKFLYIIIPYLFIYFILYHKVILYHRELRKSENIIINEKNILKKSFFKNYYNSFIGNYQTCYYQNFLYLYNNIFDYEINNTYRDIIYQGSLQLFQKIIFFMLFYIYILYKNKNQSNLFLLSIFQTTTTLIYQFEYIFHNYYGYKNSNDKMINYNNFKKEYQNNKKQKNNIKYKLNHNFNYNISVLYDVIYDINRSKLSYNINFFIKNNDRIILEGQSGSGKSTFCKIISGHFKNYDLPISEQILYINQNNYINYQYRTLLNIITENDIRNININIDIINEIINNIIPIDDIKNSFNNKDNYLNIKLNDKNLSGGQEKRIYLIMWIYYLITNIKKYKILIIDEPDKGLDYELFYKITKNIFESDILKNISIIIITHNYKIIENLTKKIIRLVNNNNNISCICNF